MKLTGKYYDGTPAEANGPESWLDYLIKHGSLFHIQRHFQDVAKPFALVDVPMESMRASATTELDQLRARNVELDEKLTFILTSMEEGSLPWWQHKHDELALKLTKIAFEREAKIDALTEALKKAKGALDEISKIKSASGPPPIARCIALDTLDHINKVLE